MGPYGLVMVLYSTDDSPAEIDTKDISPFSTSNMNFCHIIFILRSSFCALTELAGNEWSLKRTLCALPPCTSRECVGATVSDSDRAMPEDTTDTTSTRLSPLYNRVASTLH